MALYLFIVLSMGAYIFLSKGLDPGALQVWLGLSGLLAVPCYFMARSKHEVTRVERFLARAWLLFRRVVCFTAAALFAAGGVFVSISPALERYWVDALVMFLLAVLSAWVGTVGAGKSRAFSDDISVHEARKKRYEWK